MKIYGGELFLLKTKYLLVYLNISCAIILFKIVLWVFKVQFVKRSVYADPTSISILNSVCNYFTQLMSIMKVMDDVLYFWISGSLVISDTAASVSPVVGSSYKMISGFKLKYGLRRLRLRLLPDDSSGASCQLRMTSFIG